MKGKDNRHIIAFRATKLKPDEQVECHLDGWIGEVMGAGKNSQHNGQLVLTNQRVCFFRKGLLGEIFETIPISKITSVECSSRMGFRVIRIHTSHDDLAFKTFEAKEIFDQAHDRIDALRHRAGDDAARINAPAETDDLTGKLRKLAELRDLGILTEAEFSAKKAELLARI